jgi:hypothetical protein
MAECRPGDSGECKHKWIPPKDVRGRHWRHRHCFDLDIGAGLVGVDLQEHIADRQDRAVAVGDDNLDWIHAGHDRRDARPTSSHLPCATEQVTACPPSSCPNDHGRGAGHGPRPDRYPGGVPRDDALTKHCNRLNLNQLVLVAQDGDTEERAGRVVIAKMMPDHVPGRDKI